MKFARQAQLIHNTEGAIKLSEASHVHLSQSLPYCGGGFSSSKALEKFRICISASSASSCGTVYSNLQLPMSIKAISRNSAWTTHSVALRNRDNTTFI